MIHELKTWPEYFREVREGKKTFEVRKKDRPFKVGDLLYLREFLPKAGYSGCELLARVTYLLEGGDFGIQEGYCVMGITVIRIY